MVRLGNSSIFWRDFSPVTIVTSLRDNRRALQRNVVSALLARPPSGGACNFIFNSSPIQPTISLREALGTTRTAIRSLSTFRSCFRYTEAYANGARPVQPGLIAEEVAEVYPGLVVHNNKGEVETVQYHKLIPMLLNELQKQERKIEEQQKQITDIMERLTRQEGF